MNSKHLALVSLLELFSKALPRPSFHRPGVPRASIHRASKRDYEHKHGKGFFHRKEVIPTQHERVIMGRAARLGISVHEYQIRFP
jgi:hypothetical protein